MALSHGALMDDIYRYQRHFYDLSRAYYLLGRDHLLRNLDMGYGRILEIGCGTGRNLIAAGRAYPRARLYGVDISATMLETARTNITRAGLGDRIQVAEGDAAGFDAQALWGCADFDAVFFSYSLSMIPSWPAAFERGLRVLQPAGRLHVVDFGMQENLPGFFRKGLYNWLARFHVTPIAEHQTVFRDIAASHGASLSTQSLFRGYAWYAEATRLPLM